MEFFEIIANGGSTVHVTVVHPHQVALWQAAFGRELAGLFDITPAAAATEVLDAALARFQTHADELRAHLDPAETLGGLRNNRRVIERMRATLADYPDATISGAVDDEAEAEQS
ncbi:hypothetical protein [Nocardia neocaledoniensis]|uniref:hypothetical protein n=1 Tax=Nocardia neocaledoniensis TaxID=236511 RepID=UPI00245721DD|nr:hypothetical protein [Nocardia neocaledoniensis]